MSEIDIFVSKRAAAQLHTIRKSLFKERAGHILVFKMVSFIRKAAAMLGKMQIPLKERASCTLVVIDNTLYQRGSHNIR